METTKMGEIYGIIANKVNDIIPDKWEKVYLYGEVLDDSREVYFYFKSLTRNEVVYGHDIPIRYNVDKRMYRQLLRELISSIVDLYNEYKDNNESVWTNFTFLLDNTGKFNIKYNYDDVLNSEFTAGERQIIWEYEVLGVEPEVEQYKEMINKYLESKNNA
ncbi:antitoxin YezG family protein [Clostridium intestinale]|uniref:Antitoxin YezG family protein n=1 Tax=Clostridium intestinale TaxID=36845 RepID=A0A7D6ZSH7_9CLOT|nr:antitoxin YezG family protein [Clostridium intestinale]QLY81483.1 antitoxin YezG family protein [Clostridium intestinale]